MYWVIQDNLYREEGLVQLVNTLERFEIPYTFVKVIPFSAFAGVPHEEQLQPNIEPTGPVMVCGSTTLCRIANLRGWTPGSFLNDNHNAAVWSKEYGNDVLNSDMSICTFQEVLDKVKGTFFIRPCDDSKAFAGMIISIDDFKEWADKVIDLNNEFATLRPHTLVSFASVKEIQREYRFFIVDGKIITHSTYKIGNKVKYEEKVDDGSIKFVNRMINKWVPARAFVLDVALTKNGYKVVEINCINASGFYAIDVQKFVMAIERAFPDA